MSEYNPFGKPLDQLDATDLDALRSVTEGWYVEYKASLPNASAIAKSISAFANTYGGWLFYGICELSKAEAVAGTFPGISRQDLDPALQCIRQAVANSVAPSPHFETKVLWGPDQASGLAADSAIICIRVPRGQSAPYVHKSGSIYRRVADGSEPKPETDRFLLDQLWKRSDSIRKDYKRWLKRSLDLSKGEKHNPYLRVFISPDLWRDMDIWADISTKRAREIFSDIDGERSFSTMPFDTVYKTATGFVARQAKDNDPHHLSATWFLNKNLTSEIIYPLHSIRDTHTDHIEHSLDGYDNAAKYANALRIYNHKSPVIIDLNFVFSALLGLFHVQSILDKEAGRDGPIFFKAEIVNVWRARPFLDVDSVVDYQLEHGVPVCLKSDLFAPPGLEPESFAEIPTFDYNDDVRGRKLLQAVAAFECIAPALGIETGWDLDPDGEGNRPLIHGDLVAACNRALTAQRLRNERRDD